MKKALILFALGGFQGFLGWFMVSSGLSENVYVSHYRLAVHLISAFAVFGVTFWFALDLLLTPTQKKEENKGSSLNKLSVFLFLIIILQIIYGAFVAGLKAGYGYPTWPKMGNTWVPGTSMGKFFRRPCRRAVRSSLFGLCGSASSWFPFRQKQELKPDHRPKK
jgi:cytochrome c oxidase assembly protein subunit 15